MNEQEIKQAIQKTVIALAKEPKNPDHYHELAKYYAMLEQYDKVISIYDSLLAFDPNDMDALLNVGSIWFYQKEYKKALKCFEQAMSVNPSNFLVYYNLANTYAEMKNLVKI